jgi:glc operon protein GlcG
MPSVSRMLLAPMLLASASATAVAQQPQLPKAAPPYGTPITLAEAKKIAGAAEAAARRAGALGEVIAIVQPDGSLVYFEKFDRATYVSIEFAQGKARTAAVTRMPTGGFGPNSGPPPLPSLIGLPGGLPIVIAGRTVGAIGVSGTESVPGWNDVKIAEAGLAALK